MVDLEMTSATGWSGKRGWGTCGESKNFCQNYSSFVTDSEKQFCGIFTTHTTTLLYCIFKVHSNNPRGKCCKQRIAIEYAHREESGQVMNMMKSSGYHWRVAGKILLPIDNGTKQIVLSPDEDTSIPTIMHRWLSLVATNPPDYELAMPVLCWT